jgi:hypothetical protein
VQHLKKMQEKDTMGTGEFKYGPIAVAMNETFHAVDPLKYSEKDWRQIKAKEQQHAREVREIVRSLNKEVIARKQVPRAFKLHLTGMCYDTMWSSNDPQLMM